MQLSVRTYNIKDYLEAAVVQYVFAKKETQSKLYDNNGHIILISCIKPIAARVSKNADYLIHVQMVARKA